MTPAAGAWYPIALSSGVAPGTSNGTRLFGREIVVWRDTDGAAHVWEDRCPHRGMRLSLGFVRGDQIACLYHGWRYDAAGRCRHIPAHPQLTPPETIRVPALESAERIGLIWVRADGPARHAPPVDEAVTPVRSITVACSPERALSHRSGSLRRPAGGFEAEEDATPPPSLIVAGDSDARLLVGVQPRSSDECVLHIVIPGNAGGAGQKRASAWAEALRRMLELPVEPATGPP